MLSIAARPDIPEAQMSIKTTSVDGRDGNLTEELGYKNISISVSFKILQMRNIKADLRQIKAWLESAQTVQFSDDTVFYKVSSVAIGAIKNDIAQYGEFSATFNCDPFAYAVGTAKITATGATTIKNTGTYYSRPLIRVYGSGDGILTIGGTVVKLNLQKAYIDVDSEAREAFYLTTPMNSYMEGDFPTFQVGSTAISFSGGITKLEIEPRWRYK